MELSEKTFPSNLGIPHMTTLAAKSLGGGGAYPSNLILYQAKQASGPNTSAGSKNPADSQNFDYWSVLSITGAVPVGTIIWYSSSTAPVGYLICNGQAVSRTLYPDLFDAIGTTYGPGDGSTTFNLPNLLNKFIEGSTSNVGDIVDAGLPNITGAFQGRGSTSTAYSGSVLLAEGSFAHERHGGSDANAFTGDTSVVQNDRITLDASRSSSIYGNSSTVQPPAVKLLPCIKAYSDVDNLGSCDVAQLENYVQNNVVHKAGTETITGAKTFQNEAGETVDIYAHHAILSFASETAVVDEVSYPEPQLISMKFEDGNNKAVGVVEAIPPSTNNDVARMQFKITGFNCAGKTYNPIALNLNSDPVIGGYVTAYHLSTYASAPVFALLNGNLNKGTIPSSNHWSVIRFNDSSANRAFSGSDGQFGQLSVSGESDGGTRLRLTVTKNVSGAYVGQNIDLKYYSDDTVVFFPTVGGSVQLGDGSHKWGQLYSTSGTINTSDARFKTEPEPIPDEVLDAWGDVGFVQFQMLDSVEKKGTADARLHSGLIAQRIDAAFKAHSLDASRYGLFCWDSWEAEPADIDEKGSVLTPALEAGDAYSLRYEEALCMEAAYNRREVKRLKEEINLLKQRLNSLENS